MKTRLVYIDEPLLFARNRVAKILSSSAFIGVTPELVAGALVEEANTYYQKTGPELTLDRYFDSFSYTRYGTVRAQVEWVSADAVNDDKRGALFPAKLALAQGGLEVDGTRVRLGPGMNLTAEIKTGKRRVINYLLDPLKHRTSESLRER